jgi:uncharacterized membrane protein YfcA
MEFTAFGVQLIGAVIILAFVCELVDSSLGMGYGTTLTPILLLLGYDPLVIIPAILFSEMITGFLAGLFHHEFGNVDFRPHSRDFKIMSILALLSVVGTALAVLVALNIPKWLLTGYIGVLVLMIGVVILINRDHTFQFSWKRIGGLGFLAAFNKGMSGGGYGPVVTGGQVLAGVRGRSAVGIASLAEGVASLAGFLMFIALGNPFPWALAPSLVLGALVSAPLAAYVVSRLSAGRLTLAIGGLTTGLGSYTLIKVVMSFA